MERRPDLPTRRALALSLPLIPFLARAPAAQEPAPTPAARKRLLATVILLRHAEKSPEGDPRDPSLSEAGKARTRELARLLARARVSHLFASEFRRSQETLAPISTAAQVRVEIVPAVKIAELAERIAGAPAGAVVVVAGHSNTVPGIAAALGAELPALEASPQGPALSEKDFGRLFVLAPGAEPPARTSVLELAYGA